MSGQLGFDLVGGAALIPDSQFQGEFGATDPMPDGPFSVSMTRCEAPDGSLYETIPWVVRCGDGRAVTGHVPSAEIAEAIARALNHTFPL